MIGFVLAALVVVVVAVVGYIATDRVTHDEDLAFVVALVLFAVGLLVAYAERSRFRR